MLTLYGDLDSGNVYKVRLLLAQLGIAYRRVDTTQNRGEPATATFRAINPIGKIPTVVLGDGRMLSESGAILFYFAQDSAFFPDEAWDRANVLRWMFFEQYSHEPYIAVNRHLLLHSSAAELGRLTARMAANRTRGEQALAVMEQRLDGNDWLAAGRYTIADIALYAYTHTAAEGGSNSRRMTEYAAGSTGCARNPAISPRWGRRPEFPLSNGRAETPGRPGTKSDQARISTPFSSNICWSSPVSNISRMMSHPPTNSPLT
jgi:glutathione S-transferase